MAYRIMPLFSIGLFVAVAAGCASSPPTHFYTLSSTASADGSAALQGGILVGPVTVPSTVNQPQIVAQLAPNRVEMEDFERWAAPLDESIGRAVAGDLAVLLGTPEVAVAPFANFVAAYRVTISVQRFESVPGDSALVEAVWTVRKGAAEDGTRSGRTVAREAAPGKDYASLAAAHSRALAKLSADIAAAIRAMAP
jgi:uncharacterized lipoprotein YmbA